MSYCKLVVITLTIFLNSLSAGRLIEVCGIDGAGKTTFSCALKKELTERGYKVLKVSPLKGDCCVYPFISNISTLQNKSENIFVKELVENFKSDFFKLSFLIEACNIERALREYDYVLCDRYVFSFLTYQKCFNQENPHDKALLADIPQPDYSFLITVPIDVAVMRTTERGEPEDYENAEFLREAQQIFLNNCHLHLPLFLIDGELPVRENIDRAISVLLKSTEG